MANYKLWRNIFALSSQYVYQTLRNLIRIGQRFLESYIERLNRLTNKIYFRWRNMKYLDVDINLNILLVATELVELQQMLKVSKSVFFAECTIKCFRFSLKALSDG